MLIPAGVMHRTSHISRDPAQTATAQTTPIFGSGKGFLKVGLRFKRDSPRSGRIPTTGFGWCWLHAQIIFRVPGHPPVFVYSAELSDLAFSTGSVGLDGKMSLQPLPCRQPICNVVSEPTSAFCHRRFTTSLVVVDTSLFCMLSCTLFPTYAPPAARQSWRAHCLCRCRIWWR